MSFKGLVDCMLGTIIPACGEDKGVLYYHKDSKGAPYRIAAVFDEAWEFVDPDTEAVISSNQPRIGIRARDLHRAPQQDDKVVIGSRHFLVKDSLEDGQGGINLIMHLDFDEREDEFTA
jgi:hypothetical protein